MKKEDEKPAGSVAFVNVFRELWNHLGSNKKTFFGYMSLFLVAGFVELLNPLVIGLVFNSIQKEIMSQAQLWSLIRLISLLFILTLTFTAIHIIARYHEQKTGFLVGRNYTNRKIRKLLELPISWHKDHHSGSTIDKISKGGTSLQNFAKHSTFQVVYAVINLLGSVIILLFFDIYVAIAAFVISLVIMSLIVHMDKKLNKMYERRNNLENKSSAAIFDYLSNVITVITLRLKRTVKKEVDDRIMAPYEGYRKEIKLSEIKWGFAGVALSLMTVIILSYRAYTDYTTTGVILIGTLYILYGYLNTIGNTFYTLAHIYGQMVIYHSQLNNAKPIDEEYEKLREGTAGKLPQEWKEVEIKNLNFTYGSEGSKNHLDNIHFNFKKGEKIALVGESGSGKSTFLTLLRGLYDPEKAEVLADGKVLKHGMAHLRDSVTLIPQDPEIFNNTIKYNITMDLPYRKEEVLKAIKLAQFTDVVKRLDKGLKTNVMEKGVSLSGGEKQRLALARGLLAAKKSDIVLLDEPTSSVDSLNEMHIHNQVFREFRDKTVISSIHRLHLLEKFDRVYFFEKGKIIASGTLNEIKRDAKFRYLWNNYTRKK